MYSSIQIRASIPNSCFIVTLPRSSDWIWLEFSFRYVRIWSICYAIFGYRSSDLTVAKISFLYRLNCSDYCSPVE